MPTIIDMHREPAHMTDYLAERHGLEPRPSLARDLWTARMQRAQALHLADRLAKDAAELDRCLRLALADLEATRRWWRRSPFAMLLSALAGAAAVVVLQAWGL